MVGNRPSQDVLDDLAKDILEKLPDQFDIKQIQVSKNTQTT